LKAATKTPLSQFKFTSKWIAAFGNTVAMPSFKVCPINSPPFSEKKPGNKFSFNDDYDFRSTGVNMWKVNATWFYEPKGHGNTVTNDCRKIVGISLNCHTTCIISDSRRGKQEIKDIIIIAKNLET